MNTLKKNLEHLQKTAKERTVKTQTVEYDLETLVKKIKRETIKLNPDYQRKHRWKVDASSKLIESLILNIPIPYIYISQDIDVDEEVDDDVARFSVIDGQQRLTAIYDFFSNNYALTDLEVLTDLNGSFYSDLPPFLIRRLEERSIPCLRIDSTVDEQVKYDIFERLNSGSVKLEPQELRNATCRGPFKELIKKLAKDEKFRRLANITNESARVEKMEDEELVLRFFAVVHADGYRDYKGGFKKFLTAKMSELNKLSEGDLLLLEREFNNTLSAIDAVFIDALPFSKYRYKDDKLEQMSKFNASVYDAVMYLFNRISKTGGRITQENVTNLFKDGDFFHSCEGSVNDVNKLKTRITTAIGIL